ncbi:SUMF1/EgtB/PvdO family nonheme iron enzyme [Scytonema sp. NUACC21]
MIETENSLRVLRGGSWFHDPRDCRSAFRHKRDSNDKLNRIGFRIVCTFVPST